MNNNPPNQDLPLQGREGRLSRTSDHFNPNLIEVGYHFSSFDAFIDLLSALLCVGMVLADRK